MECYSAIKKNEIMPFATTWMNIEVVTLSKVTHIDKSMTLLIVVV